MFLVFCMYLYVWLQSERRIGYWWISGSARIKWNIKMSPKICRWETVFWLSPPPPAVKAVGKQGGGGQINKRQNQLSPGQICQFNNAKCLVCECLCHCVDWSLRKSVISRNNSSSTQRLGLFQSDWNSLPRERCELKDSWRTAQQTRSLCSRF